MKRALTLVAIAGLTTVWSIGCFALDLPLEDLSRISREEWRAQVNASRERLDTMRREHRSFVPRALTPEERDEDASRRVLEDESLKPGDLVATNRGLFRFQGSPDRERRAADFVRVR